MISLSERKLLLQWVDEAQEQGARRQPICACLGISLRTLQRWRCNGNEVRCDARTQRQYLPPNKLTDDERQQILAIANSDEFAALPPSQIVPILAERGIYIASESSFYRVLRQANQLRHRQASRPPQARHKPKALQATAPNQLYSWDITYLKTTILGVFFYLYLVVDVFSRKIVGWQIHHTEDSEHAAELFQAIALQESLEKGQVIVHSDNGSPMKGTTLLATLQRLGIMTSFSRPAVSNDNPYSESLFKTLKYRPDYPAQPFGDLHQARTWVGSFVNWYNHHHRHSAIRFVTPAQRHDQLDTAVLAQRRLTYETAKASRPQRWSGNTRNWDPVTVVHLNPEKTLEATVH